MLHSISTTSHGRIVAAAASLSLLVAGALPAGAAPVPRDLKTLSLADLQTLPASTPVTVLGTAVQLGDLRKTHDALAASRTRAQSIAPGNLRSFAGGDFTIAPAAAPLVRGGTLQPPAPHSAASVAPSNATVAPAPSLPLVAPAAGAQYPNDYRQFCGSVGATVCLYYPAGVTWVARNAQGYVTVDVLVQNPGVCAQEGGAFLTVVGGGCVFTYPAASNVNFVPPAHGFASTGWCDQAANMFSVARDAAHGAVDIADAGAAGFAPGATGVSPSLTNFCYLKVALNP